MFTIEEYIAKRKKEDNLNEFNKENKIDNIKICIDYIFEYFNNYIDISDEEKKTVLYCEKIEKYRKSIKDYSEEVQEWLVDIYDKHEKCMNIIIRNILKANDIFLLYNTDAEFRSESYECYSILARKYKYLKDDTEMLFQFIKDHHRVFSNRDYNRIFSNGEWNIPNFSRKFTEWINNTRKTYSVNLFTFVEHYLHIFFNNEDKWESSHKILDEKYYPRYTYYIYDYKKKSNLFNLDQLYPKISNKPFIKGKKQYIELLMMYYWLNFEYSDKEYFQEYLNKVQSEL